MDFKLLDVCCAIPEVFLANPKKNEKEILKLIEENKEKQLILFPELSLTGYTCGDLFFQNTLLEEAKKSLISLAHKTKVIDALIIIGLPISIKGRLLNCAAVLQNGKILALVPKQIIPENREYYEKRVFSSGKNFNDFIEIDKQTIPITSKVLFKGHNEIAFGIEVCEDLWAPNSPSVELCAAGALIILNPSASNEIIAKHNYRKDLLKIQSAKLNCAYMYASAGFGESTQDLLFSGEALIYEKGILLKESNRFQTKSFTLSAQLDLELLLHDRRIQSSFKDQKIEDFLTIPVNINTTNQINRYIPALPFVPEDDSIQKERCEEILNIQSSALASRVHFLGDVPMVVGVSGGLDSTLALIVCALACEKLNISKKNIIAVTMPGFGTSNRTYENAKLLIKAIGAEFREIPIIESVKLHFKDINHNPNITNSVYENAQARERTQILMDIANQVNGIVVGTGDLSELAMGWATYNGDHMAMYSVNSSVPKTLIRYIIKYYADTQKGELKKLLLDILNTPVSPELLPLDKEGKISQKTEEKIGPYELHDFFLFHFVRNGFHPEKIYELAKKAFENIYEPKEIKHWLNLFLKRFFSQSFKRSALPDGPKVGSVALSPRGDYRMPDDVHSFYLFED